MDRGELVGVFGPGAGWATPDRARRHNRDVSRHEPGQGRYAHRERERRFVLSSPPIGLSDPRRIVDRYIDGTRLRLRRVTGEGFVVYKLGQKVRPDEDDPSLVMLTNIYLTGDEHDCLLALPATEVRKTRYTLAAGQDHYAVDVFEDRLDGLVLAEAELTDATVHELPDVPGLVAEVTTDNRFSGGALAHTDQQALQTLLAAHRQH